MLWGPVAIAPVMKRPWTFQVLLPLALLVLLAVSCDRLLRNLRGETEQPTVAPVEETTADNAAGTQATNTTSNGQELANQTTGVALTLPESWSEASGLNPSADLQASDPENELYMIVMAEESPALMRLGLQENAAKYRALLKDQLSVYESESPTEVAFINENFASQYEIRGRLEDGTPVIYLHTTVVTQNRYYQIVGWTTPDQYEAYRSELQNITSTFREISA